MSDSSHREKPPRASRREVDERLLNEQLNTQIEDLTANQTLLEDSRDRYAALFDGAPIAYVATDRSGVIEDLNGAAAKLLGLPATQAKGIALGALVAPADRRRLAAHLRQCESETLMIGEALVQPAGARPAVPVELRSRRVTVDSPRILTALLDLSIGKRLEADLRRLEDAERGAREANKAKDDFIAMLSHELRTPLTPVLVAVTALRRGGLSPARVAGLYDTMVRNILAEVHLVDDLLDVTRIVRGKIQLERSAVDVHELARAVVESHAEEIGSKDLVVQIELAAEHHHTNGDRERLRQVLENLFKNATKFTPPRGHIAVSSWNLGESVVLEVSDSGIGIEPEEIGRVFNPFEQSGEGVRKGGLGLGLAICRGIVEMHGGTVDCYSRGAGQGARFVIHLDVCAAPATERSARPPRRQVPGTLAHAAAAHGPVRVLLVEDNKDIVESLRDLLELEGCEVRVARTAEQALLFALDDIDVVISDLGLPGMSGYELLRLLRARRDVPAIALSGYGTEEDQRASSAAGYSLHLTKPVEGGAIVKAIERVLQGRPA